MEVLIDMSKYYLSHTNILSERDQNILNGFISNYYSKFINDIKDDDIRKKMIINNKKVKYIIEREILTTYWDNVVVFTEKQIEEKLNLLYAKIDKDKKFKTDLIIGIPRGGVIVATMLSYLFETYSDKKELLYLPYIDTPSTKINKSLINIILKYIKGKNVLLVDDGIMTGKTISKYITLIQKYASKVKIAVLNYNSIISELTPDYYAYKSEKIIQYPWKYVAFPLLKKIKIPINKVKNKHIGQIVYNLNENQLLNISKILNNIIHNQKIYQKYKISKNKNDIILTNKQNAIRIFLKHNKLYIRSYKYDKSYSEQQFDDVINPYPKIEYSLISDEEIQNEHIKILLPFSIIVSKILKK